MSPFPPRRSSFVQGSVLARAGEGQVPDNLLLEFSPRIICCACWSKDSERVDLSPTAKIYSYTVVQAVPDAFRREAPYVNGLIDLADGICRICRIVRAHETVNIGGSIEIVALEYEDGTRFGARPVGNAHALSMVRRTLWT